MIKTWIEKLKYYICCTKSTTKKNIERVSVEIMAGDIMVAQGWKCGKCGLIRAYNRPTCNCH